MQDSVISKAEYVELGLTRTSVCEALTRGVDIRQGDDLERLTPRFHPLTTSHPLLLGLHPASYRHKLSSFPHVPVTFCTSARTLANIYYIVFFPLGVLREVKFHSTRSRTKFVREMKKRRPDTSDEKLPEFLLLGSRSCQVASRRGGRFY